MIAMSNRRHYTQSEREHWLAQFGKLQSTATSFCREHGLCYQTFLRWRRNARKTKSSTAAPAPFIELEIPARPSPPTCSELVELTFPGGLTLRIQAQTTPQP
jgi:transposase-like protein